MTQKSPKDVLATKNERKKKVKKKEMEEGKCIISSTPFICGPTLSRSKLVVSVTMFLCRERVYQLGGFFVK